ncbi:MAG: FMN-binding protein, partial [Bacillota bacterium]
GEGMHGDIKVEVAVEEGNITDIEVVEHSETEDIAEPAFEELIEDMKENQEVEVDTVSSATLSSEGLIEAVKDAVKGDQ